MTFLARLGLKLYYLRTREQRMSQQEVAKALRIRQATLSHVERGISMPGCALLKQLCRLFDVTPTFLLDEERGVRPLPSERWARRNELATGGMWVEADAAATRRTEEGRLLAQVRSVGRDSGEEPTGPFDDPQQVDQRLALELEAEMQLHPRRRRAAKG